MKLAKRWYSNRVESEVLVCRWGTYGRPVLIFPTAGGDAEEIERFLMIKVLAPLIEAGKIKVYSCDSVAGATWLKKESSARRCSYIQNQFDSFIYHELVPAIRHDCQDGGVEIVAAGASIGAFNALASICRHPDVFSHAYCLSGTYDLAKWLDGEWNSDFYFSSPLHYLPGLGETEQLRKLRERFVVIATGEGNWEDPGESWKAARVLGDKGVPNRVDPWGKEWHHDWVTWRAMMPHYLEQLVGKPG